MNIGVTMRHYDTVIIGAGPGGYESAFELGLAGVKTLLIDKSKTAIGGTCLNVGCIPTKNYLQSASFVSKISHFKSNGLQLVYEGLDLENLREQTTALINELRSGIVWMLDQRKVDTLFGTATFADAHSVLVDGETITFDHCIIATGSFASSAPGIVQNGKNIISSNEVFDLVSIPRSMVIIGSGPIGCEFASFFSAFGTEVTMIVRGSQILPQEDEDVAKALQRVFKKHNVKLMFDTNAVNATEVSEGVLVETTGEYTDKILCDVVLCATGRSPNTSGLGLEAIGVKLSSKGFINVNPSFQTDLGHIYAVGDCIDTPGFAHTAYTEARIASRNIIHSSAYTNTSLNPSTIFTEPSIGRCGLNEKQATVQGINVDVKKIYYKANAKAKILGDDSGFAKIICEHESGIILGATIIGVEATEIIHEMIIAVQKQMTYKELRSITHVHPSVSEIIRSL